MLGVLALPVDGSRLILSLISDVRDESPDAARVVARGFLRGLARKYWRERFGTQEYLSMMDALRDVEA